MAQRFGEDRKVDHRAHVRRNYYEQWNPWCKLLLLWDYLDRKELKRIFPTLAYQLAFRYSAFQSQNIQAIKRDPSVARNSLISQLRDLIANPISSTDISCVIVVDALDECVDDQPASAILSVLGRFVKKLPSAKFFITGRPEPRIRTGFRLPLLESFTQIFLLHGANCPVSIRTFNCTSRRS